MANEATRKMHAFARAARRHGWTVTQPRRGGHLRFTAPDGTIVFTSATPGDMRAVWNAAAALRRAGLNV